MSYIVKAPDVLYKQAVATLPDSKQFVAALDAAPFLKDACFNTAAFLCDVVPTRDAAGPLLPAALKAGWHQYRAIGGTSNKEHMRRLRAFTCGMIAALADVRYSRVYIKTGASYSDWDPGPELLYHWLYARKGHQPHVSMEELASMDDLTAIELAAARVLPWPHIAALGGKLRPLVDEAAALLETA